MDRVENDKISKLQEMHSATMFRCTVRLEIRGCDYFCDGIGYGGEREMTQQGSIANMFTFVPPGNAS